MEDIYTSAHVIQDHFENLLVANGCETSKIHTEFKIMYKHIKMFLGKKSPDKVWPHMFSQQKEIVISNLIHIAEIAISIPTSDAETERIFSFLCKIFSKERQSFKNDGLNDILRLRIDENFDCSRYDLATHLFLTEHPNGEVRKHTRHVDGHEYPKKQQSIITNKASASATLDLLVPDDVPDDMSEIEEISLDDFSSNE